MAKLIPDRELIYWLYAGLYYYHRDEVNNLFSANEIPLISDEVNKWQILSTSAEEFDEWLFSEDVTDVDTLSGAAQVIRGWNEYWNKVDAAIKKGDDPTEIKKPSKTVPDELEELRERNDARLEQSARENTKLDINIYEQFERSVRERQAATPTQEPTPQIGDETTIHLRFANPEDGRVQLNDQEAGKLVQELELFDRAPKQYATNLFKQVKAQFKGAEDRSARVLDGIIWGSMTEVLRGAERISNQIRGLAPEQKTEAVKNISRTPNTVNTLNYLRNPNNRNDIVRAVGSEQRADELIKNATTLQNVTLVNAQVHSILFKNPLGGAQIYRALVGAEPSQEEKNKTLMITDQFDNTGTRVNLGDIRRTVNTVQKIRGAPQINLRTLYIEILKRYPQLATKYGLTEFGTITGFSETELIAMGITVGAAGELSLVTPVVIEPLLLSGPIAELAVAAPAGTYGAANLLSVPVIAADGAIKSGILIGTETAVVEAGAGAAVGAGAGSAVPVVGTIIGAIAGLLLSLIPKIKEWIAKNKEQLTIAIAAIFAALGLFLSPIFFVPALFLGLGYLTSGAVITTGSIASASASILGGIFLGLKVVVLNPLVKGIIATSIVLLLFTTLVYFILQAGAYVVPPTEQGWAGVPGVPPGFGSPPGSGSEYSPYISVQKVAQGGGQGPASYLQFENSDLEPPLEVTFTITVTAKKTALTNLDFSLACQRISSSGSNSGACPAITFIDDNDPTTNPPDTISPLTPYTFSYVVTFVPGIWDDSIFVDTWTVTATAEGLTTQGSGSASIIFGNPPDECPNGWPILPEGQESKLDIIQGPGGAFSHSTLEAIDVLAPEGHTITARHTGIATVGNAGGDGYGKYVKISGTCDGKDFQSVYAHLGTVFISPGPVGFGQSLGLSGDTGFSTDPHLHYEFKGLRMGPVWIPEEIIPPRCSGSGPNACINDIP